MESSDIHFSVLSDEQITQIHNAALEILERIGVEVQSKVALEILHGAGASISQGNRVRMIPDLIENALKSAPSQVTIYNRHGERAVVLQGHASYFGGWVDCPDYLDPQTGKRRPFRYDDARLSTKICDALPNISWVNDAGWACDYPAELADRLIFKQMLLNTSKPLGCDSYNADNLRDCLDMAAIVVGDHQSHRERPIFFHYSEPVTPLIHTEEGVSKLLLCAEESIPCVYTPMPIAGATAPASFAGTLALCVAECLSGLVIAQQHRPGAPIIFGGVPGIMDMRTTIFAYGAPESQLLSAALSDIAHYYNLPTFGTAGISEAKTVDEQAAAECTMSCMYSVLSGANLIHDVGSLDHGTLASIEMLVLADEIISYVRHATRLFPIDSESLSIEVIEKVGPAGNYLMEKSTLMEFRKWWKPSLFDRSARSSDADISRLGDRVRAKSLLLIETYQPEPLPEDAVKAISDLEKKWLPKS